MKERRVRDPHKAVGNWENPNYAKDFSLLISIPNLPTHGGLRNDDMRVRTDFLHALTPYVGLTLVSGQPDGNSAFSLCLDHYFRDKLQGIEGQHAFRYSSLISLHAFMQEVPLCLPIFVLLEPVSLHYLHLHNTKCL